MRVSETDCWSIMGVAGLFELRMDIGDVRGHVPCVMVMERREDIDSQKHVHATAYYSVSSFAAPRTTRVFLCDAMRRDATRQFGFNQRLRDTAHVADALQNCHQLAPPLFVCD